MQKRLIITSTFISIIFIINSCSKSGGGGTPPPPPPGDPCATLSFKFAADVKPIMDATCAINSNCHATGSTNMGGPLTNYNQIFAKRASIKTQVEAGLMPQTGSLTADQKNKIICWINSGAPNN